VLLTLEDLAKRRSLVGVQVGVGRRIVDAPPAGVIVTRRRECEVTLSSGGDQLLRRAGRACDTSTTASKEQRAGDESDGERNRPRCPANYWMMIHGLTFACFG
jgi:hypothetical protein